MCRSLQDALPGLHQAIQCLSCQLLHSACYEQWVREQSSSPGDELNAVLQYLNPDADEFIPNDLASAPVIKETAAREAALPLSGVWEPCKSGDIGDGIASDC